MCGIFGIMSGKNSDFSVNLLQETVERLFRFSESRGKEASGIAVRVNDSIDVLKAPITASRFVKSPEYKRMIRLETGNSYSPSETLDIPFAIIGHSRLVTNGSAELNSNNQPVIKDGAVGVHNGIIVNQTELWHRFSTLKRQYNVDTEVFLGILQAFRKEKDSLPDAVIDTYRNIKGTASVSVLFDDADVALLATNNGSLFFCESRTGKVLVFASEKYILRKVLSKKPLDILFDTNAISQIRAHSGYIVNLSDMRKLGFTFGAKAPAAAKPFLENHAVIGIRDLSYTPTIIIARQTPLLSDETKTSMLRTWEHLHSPDTILKRCTRCLLPHTIPFITFNGDGVCNYCQNHEKKGGSEVKGEIALDELVTKYRSRDGEPDCIVGFSGGRDSAYGLYYVKNVLKMNPIAFTYDWGMLTDIGRRNQSRMCSELGIENIIISADIKQKRKNIQRNLYAWLKKPDLGMVPILMAGDKQFYSYFHKIRKQTEVKLFIFAGGHEAEEEPFKYGFCGIQHGTRSIVDRLTGISITDKIKLLSYYAKHYLKNPAYINLSIFDTLWAYYCTYILPDDYLYLYEYVKWDEEKVISTIRNKLGWEVAPDTTVTWRIDDGTAPFYNYVYMTIAGFSEHDHFRSNQIRDGKLTRDKAWELVKAENKPWFEAIEWYAEAVEFDCNKVISVINSIPKLYDLRGHKETSG